MIDMKPYILNNKDLILKYENLYKNNFNINKLKTKIREGYFDNISVESLMRFRVFLDICMFLYNNEKIHYHQEIIGKEKRQKGFRDIILNYSKSFNKSNIFNNYINFINQEFIELGSENIKLPFLLLNREEKEISLTRQLEILRNAFAHMQYGNFTHSADGRISIFSLYNKNIEKDKYKKKQMIVFEPIFHDYILKFYSNNLKIGIVYKHSFILGTFNDKGYYIYNFYEVKTKKDNSIEKSKSFMKKVGVLQNNPEKLLKFLKDNSHIFEVKKNFVFELVDYKNIEEFCLKNDIKNITEKFYAIKFLLDIESQLSNFLFHLNQLNDFIFEYKLTKNIEKLDKDINTLEEDENSQEPFKYMFLYLKSINILNCLEDDELKKVQDISIKGFKIKSFKDFIKYFFRIKKTRKEYILEGFRNSLAHGNFNLKLNSKGEIIFIFIDKFKNQKKIIEINQKELFKFVSQENFFKDINGKYKIL